MDKKDGGPIDLESLRAALAAGLIQGPWSVCTDPPNPWWYGGTTIGSGDGRRVADACVLGPLGMAAYIAACDPTTIGALLAELTARRARDAEVEALVAAAKRTTDAFCALGESTPFTRYADRCLHECEQSMVALDAARTAAHDAPDECFCDRMYPDSNPNASCGDCPTRDYAPKPPSIPEPSEEDVDVACEALDFDNDVFAHMRERVQGVLATYTARLRERIGGGA